MKANIFLLSPDLETALLKNGRSLDVVENELVGLGQQPTALTAVDERRQMLVSRLHNLAGDPEALQAVVLGLEEARLLARTEIDLCYAFLVKP